MKKIRCELCDRELSENDDVWVMKGAVFDETTCFCSYSCVEGYLVEGFLTLNDVDVMKVHDLKED
ncbi:hypothetical protein [Lactobacillus sp. ESL0225]|uniref:hypothetical protein n=1 Tax=Lactobacillus sp. ESL0225 TaxID=2069351 RepID=UPI000EFA4CE8|nr:hypothetical protein [Lactobacillus sp. ESL0225]RMC50848.1 hypothetical protein F5ESL0225_04470 [Lactobacillus sp. ESL0225]